MKTKKPDKQKSLLAIIKVELYEVIEDAMMGDDWHGACSAARTLSAVIERDGAIADSETDCMLNSLLMALAQLAPHCPPECNHDDE